MLIENSLCARYTIAIVLRENHSSVPVCSFSTLICLFVCGISSMSGQCITELFPDCLKVMLFALSQTVGVVTVSMR